MMTEQGGPELFDIEISPSYSRDKSRADLEQEIRELKQQLARIYRASSQRRLLPISSRIQ